jgi:hypothetical protein
LNDEWLCSWLSDTLRWHILDAHAFGGGEALPPLAQHKRDCLQWLGEDFENVHLWLDEYMATAGAKHRRFRHHREGIAQARTLFGPRADLAATIHVLRDCRNIPKMQDYEDGTADALGLRARWPVTAYIRYPEEAFLALVDNQLNGPFGVVLWAFVGNEIPGVLSTYTKTDNEGIVELLTDWNKAVAHKNTLPPWQTPATTRAVSDGQVKEYLNTFTSQPLFGGMVQQFSSVSFGYVHVDSLVASLALIDFEFIEQLRPELVGTDDLSVAKFCIPEVMGTPVKAGLDSIGRSALFVSPQKTLTIANLNAEPFHGGGVRVSYIVSNTASFTIVTKVGDRLFLRSGSHRAYLLASMGIKEIPCIIVSENQVPTLAGGYVAFSSAALTLPRPPLFMDYFDEKLSLTTRLQRMNKVIRITCEEFMVPVD